MAGIGLWTLGGVLTPVPEAFAAGVIVSFAVAAALRDVRLLSFWLPEARRQIPRELLVREASGAFLFGFQMGTGMRTYVPSTAPYCLALMVLFVQPPLATTLLIAAGFGVGRALTPIARSLSPSGDDWDDAVEGAQNRFVPLLGVTTAMGTVACGLALL